MGLPNKVGKLVDEVRYFDLFALRHRESYTLEGARVV